MYFNGDVILATSDNTKLSSVLGVTGAVLIALSVLALFGSTSLAQTTGYVYYETEAGTIVYLNITTTGNYTGEFYAGETPMNISVMFPSGTTGTVEILVANITENQLLALGAGSPRGLSIQAMIDLKVDKNYTGEPPVVTLEFLVESSDIQAYYWTGTEWQEYPDQTIEAIEGGYLLTVTITAGSIFDPPIILGSPAKIVGGILIPGTSISIVSLVLMIAGIILVMMSLIVLKKPRLLAKIR